MTPFVARIIQDFHNPAFSFKTKVNRSSPKRRLNAMRMPVELENSPKSSVKSRIHRIRSFDFTLLSVNRDPLDHIGADLIATAAVELRRAC